ncbi:MAG: T9SS type A sorting domain-containing protein, partial [Saprospiraceae bacterium]
RWLKLDADNGNQFRIDPELFFVGGVSAGSVTALHMIYMDASDPLTPQLDQIVQQQGGWVGNTGSPESFAYPVSALGVIDIVGALFDSTFIQTYDPYLMSIHGTADATVPYGAGAFLGQIQLNGSSSLYHRALEVGVPVYFVSVPDGTHSLSEASSLPYVAEYQIGIITRMEGIVCQTISANNTLSTIEHRMQISPNPTTEEATIEFSSEIDEKGVFILYNSIGQIASQHVVQSNSQLRLNVSNLAPGLYYCLSTWRQGQAVVQKLVIQ